jgi:hypothetical protein
MARRPRFQGSQNPNSRSYREPAPRTPTYADDYLNLRKVLGTGFDISRGPRQADFRPSPYRGIDARDVVEYENLKNQYRDNSGKDYAEAGGSFTSRRSRFQGSQKPNSRSYREPAPRTPTYADEYLNLRKILGTGFDTSIERGPRQADFRPSPYRGIDARDVVEYENLKNQYRDNFGKDYVKAGGSFTEQPDVNFRETLEGKTTKQDKPVVTNEKSKAFGDLLKRMKRF